jgi:hypothetical protein
MQKDDEAQAHENDARKSPSNCLAARRGLIRKTSRSGAINPLRGSARPLRT